MEAVLTAQHLKMAAGSDIRLRDLWSNRDLAPFKGETSLSLAPHETRVFRVQGERLLKDGFFLSELPGSVNVAIDGVVVPENDPAVHRGTTPWDSTRVSERPRYAGWGGAQADAAPYGAMLQVAGQPFTSGIGILANSRMEVKSDGQYRRLRALVGVDDSSRNPAGRVQFLVYADGKLVARTATLRLGDAPVPLEADIAGARIVELVARGEAIGQAASATWGDAALLR
jgi:hypothetical protein